MCKALCVGDQVVWRHGVSTICRLAEMAETSEQILSPGTPLYYPFAFWRHEHLASPLEISAAHPPWNLGRPAGAAGQTVDLFARAETARSHPAAVQRALEVRACSRGVVRVVQYRLACPVAVPGPTSEAKGLDASATVSRSTEAVSPVALSTREQPFSLAQQTADPEAAQGPMPRGVQLTAVRSPSSGAVRVPGTVGAYDDGQRLVRLSVPLAEESRLSALLCLVDDDWRPGVSQRSIQSAWTPSSVRNTAAVPVAATRDPRTGRRKRSGQSMDPDDTATSSPQTKRARPPHRESSRSVIVID